jgi:hypothetical protein
MSSVCQNCKTQLSCGCQRRVAVNGAQVCSTCVTSYNASLGGETPANIKPDNLGALRVNADGVINTAPSNVRIGYTPPRKTM